MHGGKSFFVKVRDSFDPWRSSEVCDNRSGMTAVKDERAKSTHLGLG